MNDTMTLAERADALEHRMMRELDAIIVKSRLFKLADGDMSIPNGPALLAANPGKHMLMGDDPRLPKMPEKPTLMDFFKYRFGPANHLLQSARHAVRAGMDEKVVLACLVHDIGVIGFIRADHGYWGAQMVAPYVDEEVSWAIRAHQALRFYADESVGYSYPESYIKNFGADYRPDPYIEEEYKRARDHKWYMTARMITVHDIYSFEPGCGRGARGIHRHHRPQFQAAEGRARLGQQPVGAYVAHPDPPDPLFVSGAGADGRHPDQPDLRRLRAGDAARHRRRQTRGHRADLDPRHRRILGDARGNAAPRARTIRRCRAARRRWRAICAASTRATAAISGCRSSRCATSPRATSMCARAAR